MITQAGEAERVSLPGGEICTSRSTVMFAPESVS